MTLGQTGSGPRALHIDGVVKRFGGATALDRVTLSLAPGESLGIAGPSGSGKTTLLDVISGFVRPDAGSTWLAGHEITRWPPHRIVRAGIARTFEHACLADRLTVQQHLDAATLHRHLGPRRRRRAVDEVLEMLELADLRAQETRTLSAREIRRVDLGRALATGGYVLLLDEPLAASGAGDGAVILSALRRLRQEGRAMVIVAHSASLLQPLCHRVASIEDGRIIADGPLASGRDPGDA